jgi:hypothetical protein
MQRRGPADYARWSSEHALKVAEFEISQRRDVGKK